MLCALVPGTAMAFQVPLQSAFDDRLPAAERIGFTGLNHMELLDDPGVFATLRRIVGMTCDWDGVWATSLGYLQVTSFGSNGSMIALLL